MKLLIDIDDEEYQFIKDLRSLIIGGRGSCKTIQYNVINAIKNGKPVYEHEKLKGEWIRNSLKPKSNIITYSCTLCSYISNSNKYNFCPNCGAKMRNL